MRGVFVVAVFLPLLAVFASGCSSVSSMLAEPEWSENYALKAECDVPQFNDGSMYTTGKTHPPEYIRGEQMDDSRFTDTIITLKEPEDVRKIVVRRRSEDSVPVDIDVMVMVNDEWETIKEVRGEVDNDIGIRVKNVADKIRIRAQRATRTSKGKAAVAKSTSGGGRARQAEMERVLREPLIFAEIEIYGLKTQEGS